MVKQSILHSGQLAVLELLYKYRYGSIELLRKSLGLKNNSGLYQKLEVLVEQSYIGKHYKKEYRLRGIPAAYYLRPRGYKALKELPDYETITDGIVKYSYKDGSRSEAFITHNLQVYAASLNLQGLYPALRFFTSRELSYYENFPKNLPDGFLSLKTGDSPTPHRYFLDIIPDGTPRYVIEKFVNAYNDFFVEGSWEETRSETPILLILTDSASSERYIQKQVAKKQAQLDMDDLRFYISTLSALRGARKDNDAIWTCVDEPDELISLVDLS